MTRRLRGPDGGNRIQNPRAHPIKHPRAKHPVGVHGGALESGADDSPEGCEGDGEDPSVPVAEPAAPERADQGAGEVVDGDYAALEQGFVDVHDGAGPVAEGHEFGVVAGGVYAALDGEEEEEVLANETQEGGWIGGREGGRKGGMVRGWGIYHDT